MTPAPYGHPQPTGHPDTAIHVLPAAHLAEFDDVCGKLLMAAKNHGMPGDIVEPFAQLTVLVQLYRNNADEAVPST